MDLEWSTAMSNSFGSYVDTAMVYMYNGANANLATFEDVYNQMLSNGYARVFSTSYGCAEIACESEAVMNTDHGIFNSMIGQGWTMVSAAPGDNGAVTGLRGFRRGDLYPASDPNLVSAWRTYTLACLPGPVFNYEVTWREGPQGCSTQRWRWGRRRQRLLAGAAVSGPPAHGASCERCRISRSMRIGITPRRICTSKGKLQGNGGTSIVAPQTAGFFAQVNAYLLYVGNITGGCYTGQPCAPIGNGNQYIYYFGLNPTYAPHYPFYDVTSGCNSNNITAEYHLPYFCAGTGYDQATGWGSFNMLQLAWAINTYRAGDFGAPAVKFTGPTAGHWYNTNQSVNWTITDTSENGNPATGVAGFSAAWDETRAT